MADLTSCHTALYLVLVDIAITDLVDWNLQRMLQMSCKRTSANAWG